MKDSPLHIAFLWHMHQPYYLDPLSNKFVMPWVRLHGIKDYYDMVAILEDYPSIHQTINMVPSLIEQILKYTDSGAADEYMDLTLKPAADLTVQDKLFILQNFFSLQWDNMLFVYPRYRDLLEKRGYEPRPQALERACRKFTTQDFLDLQVWFNLSWFDPIFKESDPLLKHLLKKGHDFSEEEKGELIKRQIEVLRMIIPEYKKMMERKQIEVTTSPYYHPILPLLCNTEVARIALPGLILPKKKFRHPEDAKTQIERAVSYHKEIFGVPPKGMWPSEGSVSEESLSLIAGAGIKWIATDEEILAKSLDIHLHRGLSGDDGIPEALYKPYYMEKQGARISMIFRDHQLSDLIGFVYSKWDSKKAVEDLIERLHRIRQAVSVHDGDHLVSIILDGENAWEHYKNDGRDFLSYLYERLSKESAFKTVRVSDYLQDHPPEIGIERLFPGSWINHNFKIWIGHEEDNAAWDLVKETRDFLVSAQRRMEGIDKNRMDDAWEKLYIAEGSDWCWWFGEEHNSGMDEKFDRLFRSQLIGIYKILGKEPPEHYQIPLLREERKSKLTKELVAFICPRIDGIVTSYYEWLPAGIYDPAAIGGAMHQVDSIISGIYYGFDLDNLFIRLDTRIGLSTHAISGIIFSIQIIRPRVSRIEIKIPQPEKITASQYEKSKDGRWYKIYDIGDVAAREIIEMAIPFRAMKVTINEEVQFIVSVFRGEEELERWPKSGYFSFDVPTEEFEAIRWCV
ncbi:MAG: glycoside hydrolase [Nitrospirae bacterium]|nr:glycoside hydrolase [Nitrospirota bacterium]